MTEEVYNVPDNFMSLLHILNRKWTILIIVGIGNHSGVRFNNLKSELRDISSKTLSETIRVLERTNIVVAERVLANSVTLEYRLTEDGRALMGHILPALKWIYEKSGACNIPAVKNAIGQNR